MLERDPSALESIRSLAEELKQRLRSLELKDVTITVVEIGTNVQIHLEGPDDQLGVAREAMEQLLNQG